MHSISPPVFQWLPHSQGGYLVAIPILDDSPQPLLIGSGQNILSRLQLDFLSPQILIHSETSSLIQSSPLLFSTHEAHGPNGSRVILCVCVSEWWGWCTLLSQKPFFRDTPPPAWGEGRGSKKRCLLRRNTLHFYGSSLSLRGIPQLAAWSRLARPGVTSHTVRAWEVRLLFLSDSNQLGVVPCSCPLSALERRPIHRPESLIQPCLSPQGDKSSF